MKIPDNKILSLIVSIVLIITVVISYNEYKKKAPAVESTAKTATDDKLSIVIENTYQSKDTDKDGLLDWEEALWKTDTNNPDSDGDGTKDGAEVALSRNPIKAGPDDKYSEVSNYMEDYTPFFKTDLDSLTSRVAKSILVKSGEGAGAPAADEIAKQIKAELEISKIYKKENLITFDPTDKTKMEKYSSDLMRIQLEEINAALANKNNIYNYADSYKKMALRMSAIEVPLNLAGLHIDYVNNFNSLSVMARRVADAEKDPVVLLATIPEYTKLSEAQKLILGQMRLYYENNGIIFVKGNV